MKRADLKLHESLEEEDISDGSPYLQYSPTPASSSTASSIVLSSAPSQTSFSPALNQLHILSSLSRKKNTGTSSLGVGTAPSSCPQSTSRLQTLPRISPLESKPKKKQAELDTLQIEQAAITKLKRWIIGVAIVDFDLDDGPVIDGIYPSSTLLPIEAENIAFCAFPDSLQFDQGSANHSFSVREQTGSMPAEKRLTTIDGFIYGYSHFTQKRDSNSKRGYDQSSVVILTQHQFPALFTSLISIFGPLFQEHELPMLEAACHNIASWGDPMPGTALELGFLGHVIQVKLPHTIDEQQFLETTTFMEKYDPRRHILASSAPFFPPPLLLFEAALPHLWSLWECLVLGEPILVFGTSPTQTSQAIWWLRDLLRPIPLAGDIRPYFTMQDGDHAVVVNRHPPKPGIILGVTNPFFEKSCAHWPHILSLGRKQPVQNPALKLSPGLSAAGPKPGWVSKTHKRYISKDRVLLKQLEAALHGDENSRLDASLALRRHFCSRTTEVITPLARYLNTLIPSPSEVITARPSGHALRLKPFNTSHFFTSLRTHGSTLPFRSSSRRTEFYERWLKTPGFGLWLAQQEHIVENVLKTKT